MNLKINYLSKFNENKSNNIAVFLKSETKSNDLFINLFYCSQGFQSPPELREPQKIGPMPPSFFQGSRGSRHGS